MAPMCTSVQELRMYNEWGQAGVQLFGATQTKCDAPKRKLDAEVQQTFALLVHIGDRGGVWELPTKRIKSLSLFIIPLASTSDNRRYSSTTRNAKACNGGHSQCRRACQASRGSLEARHVIMVLHTNPVTQPCTGNQEQCMTYCNTILSTCPDHVEALYLRGSAQQKTDVHAALLDYDAVLRAQPAHHRAALARGACKNMCGDFVGAIGMPGVGTVHRWQHHAAHSRLRAGAQACR